MSAADSVQSLKENFADSLLGQAEFRGEHTVTVKKEALHDVLAHCREALGYDYLVDITTIDNTGRDPRFDIAYELYSYTKLNHLRIKSSTPEDEAAFPTVTDIWPTANWHEREAWDMMGITFTGHPDLRRILMWEGYPYHPLRKEFPLAGKPSDMPDVAFTGVAPLQGGPFVTCGGEGDTASREPRSAS